MVEDAWAVACGAVLSSKLSVFEQQKRLREILA